ncbi:MAG: hypothetical protein OEQ18_04815 [Gammaproteobacteria bacterium]|nr:hypothetical protein [Gammaproteobacteria bacterium]
MAIDYQAEIDKIELAIAAIGESGIVEYTMPDGRHVRKDLKSLLDIQASFRARLNTTQRRSPFSYGVPRRAT